VLHAPGSALVLAEWTDAGESSRAAPIAPLHAHLDEDEGWYVLEGLLGFRVGDDEIVAEPGVAVVVPRRTPHTYWNAGNGLARYLLVMGPKTHRLIEAIHAATSRDPETMRGLFREHDSELIESARC
jgi:mannose-6-phosphate isomerase-like protein (cupin superfamily)